MRRRKQFKGIIRKDNTKGLYEYINAARIRADHHGPLVNLIVDPLARIVHRNADEDIIVRRNGAWVKFSGQPYAIKYKRPEGVIELRSGNMRGPLVATFTNATSPASMAGLIDAL
jgi:hypothetical protein